MWYVEQAWCRHHQNFPEWEGRRILRQDGAPSRYSLFKFRKPWFGSWWMCINVSVWRFTNYNAIKTCLTEKGKKKKRSTITISPWCGQQIYCIIIDSHTSLKFLYSKDSLSNTWTKKSLMYNGLSMWLRLRQSS